MKRRVTVLVAGLVSMLALSTGIAQAKETSVRVEVSASVEAEIGDDTLESNLGPLPLVML